MEKIRKETAGNQYEIMPMSECGEYKTRARDMMEMGGGGEHQGRK